MTKSAMMALAVHIISNIIMVNSVIYSGAIILQTYPVSWIPYYLFFILVTEILATLVIGPYIGKNIKKSSCRLMVFFFTVTCLFLIVNRLDLYYTLFFFVLFLSAVEIGVTMSSWNSVRSAFDVLEFKKISPNLPIMGSLVKGIGGFINLWLVSLYSVDYIPYVIAFLLLLYIPLIYLLNPIDSEHEKIIKPPLPVKYPMVVRLFIYSFLLSIALALSEYLFKIVVAKESISDIDEIISGFVGLFYLISALIGYFFSKRMIQSNVTLLLVSLPIYWFFTSVIAYFIPNLMTVSMIYGGYCLLYYTFITVGREIMMNSLPVTIRNYWQGFISIFPLELGYFATSLVLIFVSSYLTQESILLIIMLSSLMCIASCFNLDKVYFAGIKKELLGKHSSEDKSSEYKTNKLNHPWLEVLFPKREANKLSVITAMSPMSVETSSISKITPQGDLTGVLPFKYSVGNKKENIDRMMSVICQLHNNEIQVKNVLHLAENQPLIFLKLLYKHVIKNYKIRENYPIKTIQAIARIDNQIADLCLLKLAQKKGTLHKQNIAREILFRQQYFPVVEKVKTESKIFILEEILIISELSQHIKNYHFYIQNELKARINMAVERLFCWVSIYTENRELSQYLPLIVNGDQIYKAKAIELTCSFIKDKNLSQALISLFTRNDQEQSQDRRNGYIRITRDEWLSRLVNVDLHEKNLDFKNAYHKVFFLRNVPLLRRLPGELLFLIAKKIDVFLLEKNSEYEINGENNNSFCIVATGVMLSYDKDQAEPRMLYPHSSFGTLSSLEIGPQPDKVIAYEDSYLMRISSSDFNELCISEPMLNLELAFLLTIPN